jgi:hypothetical protein
MLDEGNEFNMETPPPETPEGPESSNRTFLIVGGVMAGLVLLTLVCIAVFFLINRGGATSRSATQTVIARNNALQIQNQTATAIAAQWTATPLPSPIPSATETPLPVTPTTSPTPVVAQPSDTPVIADVGLTATMAVLQTQVAANLTLTATYQATAMPKTGFADQFGLPGLIVLALVLVAVILLARRLRRNPAS